MNKAMSRWTQSSLSRAHAHSSIFHSMVSLLPNLISFVKENIGNAFVQASLLNPPLSAHPAQRISLWYSGFHGKPIASIKALIPILDDLREIFPAQLRSGAIKFLNQHLSYGKRIRISA